MLRQRSRHSCASFCRPGERLPHAAILDRSSVLPSPAPVCPRFLTSSAVADSGTVSGFRSSQKNKLLLLAGAIDDLPDSVGSFLPPATLTRKLDFRSTLFRRTTCVPRLSTTPRLLLASFRSSLPPRTGSPRLRRARLPRSARALILRRRRLSRRTRMPL